MFYLIYAALAYLVCGAAFAAYMAAKTDDWSGLVGFMLFWPHWLAVWLQS